jgi:hypothetical protein
MALHRQTRRGNMRFFVLLGQVILGALLTPLAVDHGLRSVINIATQSNFNLRYQLHFALSHFGTYVVAILLALVFWLAGRLLARLLRSSHVPGFKSLLATLVLALGFAVLSQLPIISAFDTAVYATLYRTVPPILYPLLGCVLAGLLVPGKRTNASSEMPAKG